MDLDDDARAAAGLVTVAELDGVPLLYARAGAPRPQRFAIESGFRDVVVATVKSVRFRAPEGFGVSSASPRPARSWTSPERTARVARSITTHGRSRASTSGRCAAITRPRRARCRQRYWGLAAIIRSRSAFVLHGRVRRCAPRSHPPGQRRSHARVHDRIRSRRQARPGGLQTHLRQHELVIDGDFGPLSRAAVRAAMIRVDLPGDVFDNSQWHTFLLRSGRLGFELSLQ